jgi:mannitol/fructose-specific phosphotransferase system IIA component (Ntr-type)
MATQLDPNELVTFKELLLSNSIQIDAAVQLLIDKGLITEQEFFAKLKQVQAQYQAKRNG